MKHITHYSRHCLFGMIYIEHDAECNFEDLNRFGILVLVATECRNKPPHFT